MFDSNDLVRKGIPANGDCFFNAVSVQLDSHLTGTELRQKTVEHLVSNQEHYIGYLTPPFRLPQPLNSTSPPTATKI